MKIHRILAFISSNILLLLHVTEILLFLLIMILVIFPATRDTFLMSNLISQKLCIDKGLCEPISNIKEIQEYFDSFKDNLNMLINNSFMNIFQADEMKPYIFKIVWLNGTEIEKDDVELCLDLFQHIQMIKIQTSIYNVIGKSNSKGCTLWSAGSEVYKSYGSYSLKARNIVKRNNCPKEFMNQIVKNEGDKVNENGSLKSFKKKAKGIIDNNAFIPQAFKQKILAILLLIISFTNLLCLIFLTVKHFRIHIERRENDPAYCDIGLYEQIHISIGFWLPLHLFSEFLVFLTSIIIFIDSFRSTQFISISSLKIFGFGFFFTLLVSCQWFKNFPNLYQLVLLIRLSFGRILSLFIGIIPFTCGLMLLGVFIFGMFADITKTFVRFLQLFIGLIFGDDLFNVFGYYTDGSTFFNIIGCIYVAIVTFTSASVLFPSFTATISFIHQKEVITFNEEENN